MNIRNFATSGLGLLLGSLLQAGVCSAATISISCSATGKDLEICTQGAEAWAKQSGNQVNVVSSPDAGRLALYQQLLSVGSSEIDVLQIDTVWPGILGQHLVDLQEKAGGVTDQHFASLIKNDTVGNRLVAMPWYADAGVLYYRKDLLEKYKAKVPATWEELSATAKTIQDAERTAGHDKLWGFVWQGRNYEGLMCNALEWVSSYNGGAIIDVSGKVTIDNPGAVAALTLAKGWVGSISPQGVLNYSEEEARGVFQSGDAVFMRNWPYALALVNNDGSPIKDKVGIAVLPKGGEEGRHAPILGGWQLAVSKYSKNPDAAADLVMYLTSAAEQKRRVIAGGFAPTITALYNEESVRSAVGPVVDVLHDLLTNAVLRPSAITGSRYSQVSAEFSDAVYSVISGRTDAATSLKDLDSKLYRMGRGGKW